MWPVEEENTRHWGGVSIGFKLEGDEAARFAKAVTEACARSSGCMITIFRRPKRDGKFPLYVAIKRDAEE
jgi:hypothetical protein